MPQLTREMILKQRNANHSPYPAPSPPPSLSSTCSSPASSKCSNTPSSRSSASGNSSAQRPREEQVWIPTLDEVSRADPVERMRIFQRLAREKEMDERKSKVPVRRPEQIAVPAPNGVPRHAPSTAGRTSVPKRNGSSVGIGAMALQLVRPGSKPIEHPTLGAAAWSHTNTEAESLSTLGNQDNELFSEWLVDIPDSPATSSWGANRTGPSEEMIAQWTQEDAEMERRAQEEQMWNRAFAR